jgi:dihydrofolate reductase
MREVVLYIAMSLDGYIADKDGSVDWIAGQDTEDQDMGSYKNFISDIDTVIIGYNTYRQIETELSPGFWPYEGKQSYVLTHRSIKSTKQINFVNKEAADLVNEIKNKEGKDIWICGGANIVSQLVDKNMIDKYRITVIPTLLGDGLSLFNNCFNKIKLKLDKTITTNGMVELIYSKR